MRAFLIVFDSVGIGAAPDAKKYGDEGANTLVHTSEAVGELKLPVLQCLGLGNIPPIIHDGKNIHGVPPSPTPSASYGAMQEVSEGKDTTTGHWEIAGIKLIPGFTIFPPDYPSFPLTLISEFESRTGRKVIGNKAASGTRIIEELGPYQIKEGCWIVYTSADSVFQIAAHEEIIPLPELYQACEIARELCNPLRVGRVIARPYIGSPGSFKRTENRRDYSISPPEGTLLDRISSAGYEVITVGKIDDIFVKRGVKASFHVENNHDACRKMLELANEKFKGLVFGNLIDFDMLYGHRRNPFGYANALCDADMFLGELLPLLQRNDVLVLTADHGNDPTFHGTDHTREYVPLLVYRPSYSGHSLGIRHGFFDVAQSLCRFFNLSPIPNGKSFI